MFYHPVFEYIPGTYHGYAPGSIWYAGHAVWYIGPGTRRNVTYRTVYTYLFFVCGFPTESFSQVFGRWARWFQENEPM